METEIKSLMYDREQLETQVNFLKEENNDLMERLDKLSSFLKRIWKRTSQRCQRVTKKGHETAKKRV